MYDAGHLRLQLPMVFTGLRMEIFIIRDGDVAPYLSHPGFDQHIPGIPPQVDTVNLTWEAGEDVVSTHRANHLTTQKATNTI